MNEERICIQECALFVASLLHSYYFLSRYFFLPHDHHIVIIKITAEATKQVEPKLNQVYNVVL